MIQCTYISYIIINKKINLNPYSDVQIKGFIQGNIPTDKTIFIATVLGLNTIPELSQFSYFNTSDIIVRPIVDVELQHEGTTPVDIKTCYSS